MGVKTGRSRATLGGAVAALVVVAVVGAVLLRSRGRAGLEPIPEAPRLELARGRSASLQVAAVTPRGPAQGDVHPAITFDRPVAPMATVEELDELPAPASIEPAVAGRWRWLGSSTVELVPEKPLPLATAFRVTVHAGLRALDGSTLAEAQSFDFETARPTVDVVAPRPGWRWVERRQRFSVTFDQPVAGLEEGVQLRVGGAKVPVQVGKGIRVIDEELAAAPGYLKRYLERRKESDRRTRYEITPERDLPGAAAVELSVGDEVHGAEGPLAVIGDRAWKFQTFGPMSVTAAQGCWRESWDQTGCPFGPLVLRTANAADARGLRKLLSIEPPVEIDWERAEGHPANDWDSDSVPYLVVPGRFRPGTRYAIKLAAGLPDPFGQRAPAWQGELTTADLPSEYDLGTAEGPALHLLEAEGDGALPLRSSNVDLLDVRLWKLTAPQLAALLVGDRSVLPPGEPTAVESFATRAGKNVVKTQPLSVRRLLGGSGTGLFLLRARSPSEGERDARRVLGQLTNLAVHAKLGTTSGMVWVTRVSDGAPVEGAEVALHDAAGGVTWRGTTGKDGIVQAAGLGAFATPSGSPKDRSQWRQRVVSASKDGDTGLAVASWSGGLWPGAFGLQTDSTGGAPAELGLLTAERGIYRPGEKVHLKGIVRYRAMGAIRTPRLGTLVRLKILDAKDGVALEREIPLSRFGTFSAELDVAADAPLGTWRATATASIGEDAIHVAGDFRVEAYRAPQFRVDVAAPATHLAAGDPVQAQVMARYLFGAALGEAPVKWSVVRKTLDFRPPRNDGFSFGVQTWWWDDGEPEPSGDVFASGRGTTDALGAFSVAAGKAEASADRTWEYDVEAEVEDLSRQSVADRAQLIVHPAALYAGLRRAVGFAQAGRPMELEVVAVTPTGERREAKVAVEVRRREWKWIKKKVAGERWLTVCEPVEELVGRCTAAPGAASASCSVTPDKPGFHVIDARVADDRGRTQVTRTGAYVIGDGWVGWQRDDTDRIDLVPDKATYDVGETARILVKSPFPAADALLSVEREGVMSARHVKLAGAATVLEVPIGADAVPNVFVGLVAARGRVAGQPPTATDDPGRPAVKTGYVELKVERRAKRLSVQVSPAASEYRPRDTVKVDLLVKDAAGRGVPAEVTVWAVDEAVLRLTGYKVPDVVDAIHPPRGLAVRAGEPLLGLVLRKLFSEKGASAGGGGGGLEGAAMRSRFKTTPLFAPAVVADAQGRAHVEFQLPDNLTGFRIMAMAVTQGELAGSGQANITVARPLIALPALPRAARVGDRFEAGVVVHSPGAKVGAVDVTAEAQGLKLEGAASRHVALGGKPREVRFRFVAERAGEAVLRFRVKGGSEQDGVEQRLPVTLPVSFEATALQGETAGAATEKLILPKGVRTDVGGVEVTLASTALGGFAEGMTQLVDYPYGCLEQLASRLVPFVALRELASLGITGRADWLLPSADRAPRSAVVDATPDELVRRTVKAIEARQQPDGSYRYWEGGSCADPWSSAYATWSLGRADRAGVAVDRGALRRGQAWLASTVLAGRCIPCGRACTPPSDAARVFALFALARTGAARASYDAELLARRERLPLFSKAMLADAVARGGDAGKAGAVLDEVLGAARVTGAEVHLEEAPSSAWDLPWSSDARSTAMALEATLAIRPDHPYVSRMITWLSRARGADGRFRNTQEAAFTLTALVDFVRVREPRAPAFTAQALLGGRPVASQEFRGRTLDVRRVRVSMSDLLAGRAPGAPLPFELRRDGKSGTLYYGALLRAASTAMPTTSQERGIFVQRWLEPWVGGGQVRAAAAGEVLRLRVRVSTPQERNFVAVEVPLPSGLEAVDTTLASSARQPGPVQRGDPGDADDRAADANDGTFWTPFNHVELRDDRVLLFADWLPAGLHTWSLPVRATTPGEFLLAPARGEEMYAPEVFGRSEGGTFTVSTPAGGGP
ncbi:MAG TPA: MG2 domain-containing protein [Anaeromyxobacteraceae bacterium]|nr:MG2 domain-containing protein [Anaeromyxobacteraceae bacterium]